MCFSSQWIHLIGPLSCQSWPLKAVIGVLQYAFHLLHIFAVCYEVAMCFSVSAFCSAFSVKCWVSRLRSIVIQAFVCEQLLWLDDGQKQLFPDSCECFVDSDIRRIWHGFLSCVWSTSIHQDRRASQCTVKPNYTSGYWDLDQMSDSDSLVISTTVQFRSHSMHTCLFIYIYA